MLRRKVQILRPASMFNSVLCCIMQTRHLNYNKKKQKTKQQQTQKRICNWLCIPI